MDAKIKQLTAILNKAVDEENYAVYVPHDWQIIMVVDDGGWQAPLRSVDIEDGEVTIAVDSEHWDMIDTFDTIKFVEYRAFNTFR